MSLQGPITLINPQNGNLAFKIFYFEDNNAFDHLQRLNYYAMLLVTEGEGRLKADFAEYDFTANSLLCFSPYQPFLIDAKKSFKGVAVNFHPDFFCIHRHHNEVACSGVLFNNIYQPPFHYPGADKAFELRQLVETMKNEMQKTDIAQYELLVSYLKIFLITASRSKTAQLPEEIKAKPTKEPFVLQQLKDAIELHYRKKHSAGEYAAILNVSPKALARITKVHFNKTPTHLIAERIVIEAKRELYLTSKPVKTIAWELGFDDEYYFSRFFKVNAEVSPQLYRETVGFAKGEEIVEN
ncbi:MAG: helix-turn-helix domain-containing protein [Chitinophagaceae bacterium]